jgi:CHASE2 domain-containing sensor protein
VAFFMVLMFAILLLIHKDKTQLAITGVIVFAVCMTSFLYGWLTSPLEPEHH